MHHGIVTTPPLADSDALEKNREKFDVSSEVLSSRNLSTNSQTKGIRSKLRISLVFSTHFHSYQPGFAIIATNNLH